MCIRPIPCLLGSLQLFKQNLSGGSPLQPGFGGSQDPGVDAEQGRASGSNTWLILHRTLTSTQPFQENHGFIRRSNSLPHPVNLLADSGNSAKGRGASCFETSNISAVLPGKRTHLPGSLLQLALSFPLNEISNLRLKIITCNFL